MAEKRSLISSESRESSVEESTRKRPRKGLESLARRVSPPPTSRTQRPSPDLAKSTAAAAEAGEKDVEDHLAFYSAYLLKAIRPQLRGQPRLDHAEWIELYTRNAGSLQGCHFVVHQHDHPVAGTHYDLRLQCNPTSSISFAIMYGLPGDPNSRRLNRNATETRVHCLWNHLIETASYTTGSMLIWDTGTYEVLPHRSEQRSGDVTEDDSNDNTASSVRDSGLTQQQKLHRAFQRRKITIRLHGTCLPRCYTLGLRLTKDNFRSEQPKKPTRRRRRAAPKTKTTRDLDSDSGTDRSSAKQHPPRRSLSSLSRLASPPPSPCQVKSEEESTEAVANASDDEDDAIRANNAYTGAVNDIGSVHQRKWYLSVNREASGFVKKTAKSSSGGFVNSVWVRKNKSSNALEDQEEPSGFERFVVGGREVERSVVTGRLAGDILSDEGVVGYVPRGLWRPVAE